MYLRGCISGASSFSPGVNDWEPFTSPEICAGFKRCVQDACRSAKGPGWPNEEVARQRGVRCATGLGAQSGAPEASHRPSVLATEPDTNSRGAVGFFSS